MSTVQAGGGIGFTGMLAIVFIVLKLTKVIAWSWWWVLSPLWLPFVVIMGTLIMFIMGTLIMFMSIIFFVGACIWVYEKITSK